MSQPVRRVLLGRIVGAHGIRGDVLIASFAAVPENIASYGPLSDMAGARIFKLKVVRTTPKGVIGRVEGVNDRTAAEKLKGSDLYIARDQLPEAEDGAYYYEDLVGLRVEDKAGRRIGTVVAVLNFGAGDLLEIRLEGQRHTELIPFQDAFVPEVNVGEGRVTVVMPDTSTDGEPPAAEE